MEEFEGQRTHGFELYLHLVESGRLDPSSLITHRFPLGDYRQAFLVAHDKARHRSFKVLFDLEA